jgi:hypothetical protein
VSFPGRLHDSFTLLNQIRMHYSQILSIRRTGPGSRSCSSSFAQPHEDTILTPSTTPDSHIIRSPEEGSISTAAGTRHLDQYVATPSSARVNSPKEDGDNIPPLSLIVCLTRLRLECHYMIEVFLAAFLLLLTSTFDVHSITICYTTPSSSCHLSVSICAGEISSSLLL